MAPGRRLQPSASSRSSALRRAKQQCAGRGASVFLVCTRPCGTSSPERVRRWPSVGGQARSWRDEGQAGGSSALLRADMATSTFPGIISNGMQPAKPRSRPSEGGWSAESWPGEWLEYVDPPPRRCRPGRRGSPDLAAEFRRGRWATRPDHRPPPSLSTRLDPSIRAICPADREHAGLEHPAPSPA